MYISTFELFKIGIGPSSSHTVGPMIAAKLFSEKISSFKNLTNVSIDLYGSLALTGKGHGTDKAISLGLMGFSPETLSANIIDSKIDDINNSGFILLPNSKSIKFDFSKNIIYNNIFDKYKYSNTMVFKAFDKSDKLCENIFYSIGGGFIIDDNNQKSDSNLSNKVPFNFKSGNELLKLCHSNDLNIYDIVRKNEEVYYKNININDKLLNIWKVMNSSIYNGMTNTGVLNGNLKIKRRANALYKKLLAKSNKYDPLYVMDWVNIFAIAVSEENAAFGKIVTSPTNGASGIIPAVIKYYKEFVKDSDDKGIINFLLTSSAIGSLFKRNASISGAEAGCQGEVGVACSMAAAGLTAAKNGTYKQIENAAEIAMEHNLGLTCDPVNGLVQIPCIERNAMGAIKAINACRLALNGSGTHKVSLDQVIKTMWETGKDMNSIYKETSRGGLAVNVIEC
tara:strand:+ start:729 stop:2084 length:1356 start_codon:yes stop_codon:yes gene_type:complete